MKLKSVKETGMGSRDWSQAEIKELLEKGSVSGYQGHHIKTVKEFPELAADPKNIKFLKSGTTTGGMRKGSEHYNEHNKKKK